ncbi:MAG: 5-formyltetrahydrofolate cyclo-ligase [Porticoccaceae bacterium]|jgi:5-formyltetrahydrofolate cyclo-ligase|nr:5-formyltetrahydrofolate cyclo-ligase [Porticoccaceae bacterium]MBT4164269.1 5-formyltetrahydrofolate cyclo-ligase [Porticoccaceae bacterium]MBT4212172.1 5-formyltetrahydrofolate cyclo-ligase [Porticoccaceae bacterium]MBT4590562.1 5-formyltetrahydrofolate cyclo-ligase [Porticoccaceae bacterium]MBT5003055.1 5-formyltetrahydrofolate cyclo-ligase [Porticoccaceae bacterium]
MNSGEIRSQLRVKRRSLTEQEQQLAAQKISSLVNKESLFIQGNRVGVYLANDGEIDPSLIVSMARTAGCHCFLPVIDPIHAHCLYFAQYDLDSELNANRYGILEPVVEQAMMLSARDLDILLMPLVAFDREGTRIGMGGGFYDRSLAFMAETEYPKPALIGLAHSLQEMPHLVRQQWDIPLHLIATEKEVICVKQK